MALEVFVVVVSLDDASLTEAVSVGASVDRPGLRAAAASVPLRAAAESVLLMSAAALLDSVDAVDISAGGVDEAADVDPVVDAVVEEVVAAVDGTEEVGTEEVGVEEVVEPSARMPSQVVVSDCRATSAAAIASSTVLFCPIKVCWAAFTAACSGDDPDDGADDWPDVGTDPLGEPLVGATPAADVETALDGTV